MKSLSKSMQELTTACLWYEPLSVEGSVNAKGQILVRDCPPGMRSNSCGQLQPALSRLKRPRQTPKTSTKQRRATAYSDMLSASITAISTLPSGRIWIDSKGLDASTPKSRAQTLSAAGLGGSSSRQRQERRNPRLETASSRRRARHRIANLDLKAIACSICEAGDCAVLWHQGREIQASATQTRKRTKHHISFQTSQAAVRNRDASCVMKSQACHGLQLTRPRCESSWAPRLRSEARPAREPATMHTMQLAHGCCVADCLVWSVSERLRSPPEQSCKSVKIAIIEPFAFAHWVTERPSKVLQKLKACRPAQRQREVLHASGVHWRLVDASETKASGLGGVCRPSANDTRTPFPSWVWRCSAAQALARKPSKTKQGSMGGKRDALVMPVSIMRFAWSRVPVLCFPCLSTLTR